MIKTLNDMKSDSDQLSCSDSVSVSSTVSKGRRFDITTLALIHYYVVLISYNLNRCKSGSESMLKSHIVQSLVQPDLHLRVEDREISMYSNVNTPTKGVKPRHINSTANRPNTLKMLEQNAEKGTPPENSQDEKPVGETTVAFSGAILSFFFVLKLDVHGFPIRYRSCHSRDRDVG